jgi:acyl-CoA thioesterase YciA
VPNRTAQSSVSPGSLVEEQQRADQPRGDQPRGELSLRTVAMPADTNPSGDIFGGWIMSLMDLAAGVSAGTRAKGRVATAAVSNLSFLQPVKVGDVVCVYTDITRTGRTSMTVAVEAWVLRRARRTNACDGGGIRSGRRRR